MSTKHDEDGPRLSCVSRREFMIRGSMTGIAIVLAGCSLGNGPTAPGNVSLTINVSDYPALANAGGVAYVTSNNNPLAVVRLDSSNFAALSRVCPHRGRYGRLRWQRIHLPGARRSLQRHGHVGGGTGHFQSHYLPDEL